MHIELNDSTRSRTFFPHQQHPTSLLLTGNTEITGVIGSSLPNGVLTDRGENQIRKASMTFESDIQGAHSP